MTPAPAGDAAVAPPTVGILYPGHAAEDDYPRLAAAEPQALRLPLVHTTIGVDEHTVEALRETGSHARLAEGAGRLQSAHAVDALMWACTSGSFAFGRDGARAQVEALREVAGVPTSSTSLAFAHALEALDVGRVGVAASYPQPLAEHFRSFLTEHGVEVLTFAAEGVFTAAEVGHLGRDLMLTMIRAVDTDDVEAVLVPDTALHSLDWVAEVEHTLGKPVLTANQVTVWEGLRLTGRPMPTLPQLGRLGRIGRPTTASSASDASGATR